MRRTVRILLAIALGLGALDATMPTVRADLTIFMSATGDRIDRVTPPDPRSQFAQLPYVHLWPHHVDNPALESNHG